MSGKNKATSQNGRTTAGANVLANSVDAPAAETEEVLSISALQSELEKACAAISSEMQASLAPINQSLDALRKKLDDYEPRFTEMEEALTDHSDRLTSLEKRVEKLQQENKELTEKTDDLENRSRRNNLRVMGLPEGYEGGAVSAFMSKFLVDLLQDDSFKTAPELDRAHRTLRAKPTDGERPRPIIIRFLCFQQREQVLTIARRKGQLIYQGHRIFIFPDLSNALAK